MKNYYHILNLSPSSSQAEIKKAYRQLAMEYHPDKNNGDSSSEERFKEIAEAYLILGDEAKRNAYDFAKGHRKDFRQQRGEPGKKTPWTFLMLFKRIKNRVFNAGGFVNKDALFKVIDNLLSDETITFLIRYDDRGTNALIIEDILISCLFLNESDKPQVYTKLLKLANGHTRLTKKIELLQENASAITHTPEKLPAETPTTKSVIIFIAFLLLIILLMLT